MANSAQARKRAHQAEKRRQQNAGRRSMLRTSVKQVVSALKSGDKEAAAKAFEKAVPIIDSMAGSGMIHANKAARHKTRLNAQIKAL